MISKNKRIDALEKRVKELERNSKAYILDEGGERHLSLQTDDVLYALIEHFDMTVSSIPSRIILHQKKGETKIDA